MLDTLTERIKKRAERTAPAFEGPVWANMLGYQLLRIMWLRMTRGAGHYEVAPFAKAYADILSRDGIVLVPDVLPPEVFAEIRKEYEKDSAGLPVLPLASKYIAPKDGKTRVGYSTFTPKEGTKLRELLDTKLFSHPLLFELGSTVVGHRIDTFRPPQIFVNRLMGKDYPDLNSDIFYHADVSYPGVKAFYYLSDTDETNGAFTYAKGTHRITKKRLAWEYQKSIEHAKHRARVNNPRIQGDETGRSWHNLTREEESAMGIKGTPMVGKANSLVVFNVMGFHRRGDFTSDKLREFVLAYYRE